MTPAGVQVFVALEPVDMRCGFERLSAMVRERLGYEPRSGALFVFVGRGHQLVKILFADATGICVFAKRLDKGVFSLPASPAGDPSHIEVDEATLDGLQIAPSIETSTRPSRRPRVH
ncbi:MAG: IS66 family insertion sequence element accessory protein TnpB [Polyangiaceae bacterium]|jgi:transposase